MNQAELRGSQSPEVWSKVLDHMHCQDLNVLLLFHQAFAHSFTHPFLKGSDETERKKAKPDKDKSYRASFITLGLYSYSTRVKGSSGFTRHERITDSQPPTEIECIKTAYRCQLY